MSACAHTEHQLCVCVCMQSMSYVSRRRMDDPTFDSDAVDEEGLPIVYNEQRIAEYCEWRRAELTLWGWGQGWQVQGMLSGEGASLLSAGVPES